MIHNFEIGGRQSGKTLRILERMLDGEHLVYVAATAAGAQDAFDRVMEILLARGTSWDDGVVRRFRKRFITWRDAADPRIVPPGTPVVVDNLDIILAHMFGGNVDTVTMRPPKRMTVTSYHHFEGNPDD